MSGLKLSTMKESGNALIPSHLAINSAEAFQQANRTRISSFTAVMDLLQHNWSQFVLNYDLRQQFALLRSLTSSIKGIRTITPKEVSAWPIIAPLLILPLIWFIWQRFRQQQKFLLQGYLKCVAQKQQVKKLPTTIGLFDLAAQTDDPLCQEFAQIYGGAVYQDRNLSRTEIKQLRQIIRQLSSR